MKILKFQCDNENYEVNEEGYIRKNPNEEFSSVTKFIGGKTRVNSKWICDVSLREVFETPKKLEKCLGVDASMGFIRTWCNGRIINVSVTHM